MILKSFLEALTVAKVTQNDVLYVASDITMLLREARKKYGASTKQEQEEFLHSIIDTLQVAVSNKGTILIPVFSWAFCRGEGFDVNNTKSEIGAFGNWIMQNRRDFRRTKHPIYSFLVWGEETDFLCALNNISSWGDDSPFAFLHRIGGKMLFINVSIQRGCTFMHYVEQKEKVPYRYHKDFSGFYIDEKGLQSTRKYSMYVRDLAIESKEKLPDELFDNMHITHLSLFGNLKIKTLRLDEAYEIISNDLKNNQAKNCYEFVNYELDWSKGATHNDEVNN